MKGISCKEDSVRLYERGAFGNKGLTWNSVEDYFSSNYSGVVLVRSKTGGGGGICLHDLTMGEVKKWYNENRASIPQGIWINAAFPKDLALVQGESMFDEYAGDWYLRCSFEKGLHMRDALKSNPQDLWGMRARTVLKHFMSPSSFVDYEELRNQFPHSVIEFSVYGCYVGQSPHRNTMFWEVRDY